MAYKQTYENYYKQYYRTPNGKSALAKARERYHNKLRAAYPGMGINRASRQLRNDRELSSASR